ncbi:unnamed protein product [Cyprideis torosa]|uniref:Uncharacterized protein n=1 Tax=Cyprideis torosa TaxID=163714 RepID=A0A7R8ZSF5_9CRUS|nr:unnamed protein product [Cyprideis torosa]CAG0901502.1 unnamed protein product [Cyprideis torosa]
MGGTDGRRGFSDFWKINLRELVWIRLCIELPHPLYFHSAAVTSAGKLWIFGGVKSVDEISRSKSVFSVWLKVPQLQEMAWEGLLYYNPGLPRLKDETLRSLGIPEQFIRRCTNKTKTGNPHCYCAIYRHMPGAGNEAA